MANIETCFQKFHSNIALDESRSARIVAAHQNLREKLRMDAPLSRAMREIFLQGSYAQSTAVRPQEGGTFDVDVVLAMDFERPDPFWGWNERRSPRAALQWVATRLRGIPGYEGRVRQRGRCVRIDYAGEFHMDVVPAQVLDQNVALLEVPDRDRDEWIRTNPKGYLNWCTERNRATGGRLARVTKYLKWWRNHRVAQDARPKSIVLQTLIGECCRADSTTDAQATATTLRRLYERLDKMPLLVGSIEVENPALRGEDLAASWTRDANIRFRDAVGRAADAADAALADRSVEQGARVWQRIFGDRFPLG